MSLRDEAAWWTCPVPAAIAAFAVPLAGAALLALAGPADGVYHFVVREDSLLEWLQAAGYATGAVAAALVVACTTRLRRLAFAGLVLACLFLLGEEISWGQRIVGFATPLSVADGNRQGELTLHNLDDEETPFAVAQLLIGAAGALLPWLLPRRWWIPPRFLSSAFAVLAAYWVVRLGFVPRPHYGFAKFSEWPEACFSFAVALFAVLTVRRDRIAAHGRSASG